MLPYFCLALWASCVVSPVPSSFSREDQVSLGDPASQPAAAPTLFELTHRASYRNGTLERRDPLDLSFEADRYFLQLNVGAQLMYFHVDTGSQTFWAARPDCQCFDSNKERNLNRLVIWQKRYCGAGEWVKGDLSRDRVTVDNHQFKPVLGAATETFIAGNGIETGVLGLAGPECIMGDIEKPNDELFVGMFAELVRATEICDIFSLALSRRPFRSYLEFGGRLNAVQTIGEVARTPLFTVASPTFPGGRYPDPGTPNDPVGSYVITVSGYKIGGNAIHFDDPPFHTLLDSGHDDSIIVPAEVAYVFNREWLDTGLPDWESPDWSVEPAVDCGNLPPELTIIIEDVEITIEPRDLIKKDFDGVCHGTLKGSKEVAVFGTPFFRNVVAVHDLKTKQMEIQQRARY